VTVHIWDPKGLTMTLLQFYNYWRNTNRTGWTHSKC